MYSLTMLRSMRFTDVWDPDGGGGVGRERVVIDVALQVEESQSPVLPRHIKLQDDAEK